MNVAVIDIHAVINTGAVERYFKKSFIIQIEKLINNNRNWEKNI